MRGRAKLRAVVLATLALCAASGCSGRATCSDFEQDVCESALRCAPRVAVELDDHGEARERFVACDAASRVCGATLTCGQRPRTGEPALFSDTCLPAGWTQAPAEECAAIVDATRDASGQAIPDAGMAADGGVPPT